VRAIPALRRATPTQRAAVAVNRGGSALRWEALHVDLSVAGLLLSAVGADERRRDVARMLGQATSATKAATSRANGSIARHGSAGVAAFSRLTFTSEQRK